MMRTSRDGGRRRRSFLPADPPLFALGVCLLLLSLLLVNIDYSRAEEASLSIILDGSGSMWGQLDGESKINVAKNSLLKLLRDISPAVHVAVTVYGHRREQDCSDIEEIASFNAGDRDAALKRIESIKPLGKSPIAESITQAAERLAVQPRGKRVLLLITDGVETCDKDPCNTVEELKKSGIEFELHVVGFSSGDADLEQFTCLARAGGGTYFDGTHSAAFVEALNNITASVERAAVAVVAKKIPTPKGKKPPGSGAVVLQPPPWLIKPNYWRLIDVNDNEEIGRFTELTAINLPSGEYRIAWRQYVHSAEVILSNPVLVDDGNTTTVELETGIRLDVPPWTKPPFFWSLEEPGSAREIARFNSFEPFLISPGNYNLLWRQYEQGSESLVLRSIQIERGKINYIKIRSAIEPKPASWIPKQFHSWGLRASVGSEQKLVQYLGNLDPQLLPAGIYDVFFRLSRDDSTDSILGTVSIVDDAVTEFPINSGIQLAGGLSTPPPLLVLFKEIAAGDGSVTAPTFTRTVSMRQSYGPMPLRPAHYRIEFVPHNGTLERPIELADDLELAAGQLLEIDTFDVMHPVREVTRIDETPEILEAEDAVDAPAPNTEVVVSEDLEQQHEPEAKPPAKVGITPTATPEPDGN